MGPQEKLIEPKAASSADKPGPTDAKKSDAKTETGSPKPAPQAAPAPPATAQSPEKKTQDKNEKRVDPHDGAAYTFAEIQEFYKTVYSKKQIQDYWNQEMNPVGGAAKSKAKSKAKTKAKAR